MFLQMGQFGTHPHFAAIRLVVGCSSGLGSIFMGDFKLVAMAVFVLLSLLELGGISQSFLVLKRFPDIFPALDHGVPAWIGASSKGGGLFSGTGVRRTGGEEYKYKHNYETLI